MRKFDQGDKVGVYGALTLEVLEDKMRQHLGEHYAGSLNVSAYPAFVASTDHFIPGNPKSKDRSKFLSIMDSSGILQKTGIQTLAEKIGSDMAENTKAKIRKSNFNKANDAVLQLKGSVSDLNTKNFKPLLNSLQDQERDSILQLESATDSLKNNIESSANSLITKKRENIRNMIYVKISDDINNDVFKKYLEEYIKAGVEDIEIELPRQIGKQIETFLKEVKDITGQFQEHVKEFMDDASMAGDMDLNLNIKISNGINVTGLIGTAIGAIALIFASGGWALAVGALGVIVSFAKAIRAFFDSDYKMAQQRKASDENINKIFDSVKSSYDSQMDDSMKKLEVNLKHIKNKFELPAHQVKKIISSLIDSARRLELVSKKIIKEGSL